MAGFSVLNAGSVLAQRAVSSRVGGQAGGIAGRLAKGLIQGDPGAINKAIASGSLALQDAAVAKLAKVAGPAADLLGALLMDARRGEASPVALTPAPVWGGLTIEQAKQLHQVVARQQYARKNLWHVAIVDANPPAGCERAPGVFNLFAVDASLSPCTMPGESIPVGSAAVDKLAASERVELRMVVMDDEAGTIKRWFTGKCAQQAHGNGTFGLPVDYLIGVTLHHMDVLAEGARGQFVQSYVMRCSNIDTELSRREQAMEELALTFTQFDTFMNL